MLGFLFCYCRFCCNCCGKRRRTKVYKKSRVWFSRICIVLNFRKDSISYVEYIIVYSPYSGEVSLVFAAYVGFQGNVGISLLYGHVGESFVQATDIVFEFTKVIDSAADAGDRVMDTVYSLNRTIMEAIPSANTISRHQVMDILFRSLQ